MAIPDPHDPDPTTTAVVTLRIPSGGDGLLTDAEERLSRAEHVDGVTIEDLHRVDPELSATLVTVGVTLRWTRPVTDATTSDRLADVSGLVSVDPSA